MSIEKERKIFQGVLWTFLASTIIFYTFWLSSGRASLPAPLWLMLLILVCGFIVFTFVPDPGREKAGPPEGRKSGRGWYPRTLADIVERAKEPGGAGQGGLYQPGSAVAPVPLVPLLLLLAMVIISTPRHPARDDWMAGESARLMEVYDKGTARLAGIERIASEITIAATDMLENIDLEAIDANARTGLIARVDSLAAQKGREHKPFGRLGVQVFSESGKRIAWGGIPRYLGRVFPQDREARLFTNRTQLYTLIVSETPVPSGGRVIVDIPLEVNYRISNRFLRSTGLGEMMSGESGDEVEYGFWMGSHAQGVGWDYEGLDEKGPLAVYGENGDVRVHGLLESSAGQPLAHLSVRGRTFQNAAAEKEGRKVLWEGILLALCVITVARWSYRRFAKSGRGRWDRILTLLKRIVALLFFLALIRHILLRLDIPNAFFGTNLFDPALFADDLPGGLMRTIGDYLISSIFLIILVFGSIKVFRTYFGGSLEKNAASTGRPSALRFLAKTALMWAVMIASSSIVASIVSRVVLNSNPRVIGLDAEFFSVPVLSLHLALLLSVSAVFIGAIFFLRLIFVMGKGTVLEGILAAAAALALTFAAVHPHWSLMVASAALVLLSARIFPILKKEEVLSVIFSSFFLVLICSLVIYGISSERYDQLRRGRVVEKIQNFNYPEDTWLMIVLPDVCESIFESRSTVARVLEGKESAAFEIWAESGLSRFGFSSVFDVYNAAGERFSRFSVGMPLEVMSALPDSLAAHSLPHVYRISRETGEGKVRFLIGVAPLYHPDGAKAGFVEIKVPYFYENPRLLARSGPMAPEIFQNIESGTLAPRVDEPEDLLVARIEGGRVAGSSSSILPAGTVPANMTGEWFEAGAGDEKYRCTTGFGADGNGFLAGYRKAGFAERVLQWAMIISLDIMLTILSLSALFVVRKLPILGRVTPAVSVAGGMSFRRKLLLSFLAVSVLPVILMGIFSSRYIGRRFEAEGDREAVSAAQSAGSFLRHTVRSEAEAFAGSQYLGEILSGRTEPRIRDVSEMEGMQFTLFDSEGKLLLDESMSDFNAGEARRMISGDETGRITLTSAHPHVFCGTVIRVPLPGGSGGYLYYRRRLDDGFVSGLAGVLGRNLNIYFGGSLRASSERELFTGGFLNPILAPSIFADIGLGRTELALQDQSLGEYSYKVANISIPALRGDEAGVLSVPLLYRSAAVRKEILRAYALIMGLLALIFSVAVTIGVFLAGKIINPIAALREGTRKIIRGDLEFRLEAESQDEIGELVHSFNTMTEALREARRDLLERQRYLAAILDNIAAGVVSTGADGRIVTVNPSAERILGLGREELLGVNPGRISKPGLEPFAALFAGSGEDIVEKEITLFDGEDKRILKTVIAGLSAGAERLGTVVLFDDLTELIRTKKLSAWVEMARQIAHEVKNPLTPIKLSAQLMRRAYDEKREEFDEIFEEGVETVIRQTEILRRIASEFSSFGKASQLHPEPVEIDRFISEILSGYRGAGNVEISYRPEGRAVALADREALRKIFVNLIENAIDAMQSGGLIIVRCGREGETAWISVTDSGTGLPPEVEERLFEPYFSTKTTGTGLGLAISQSLARDMEGSITLRNREDGPGVKATVRIPAVTRGAAGKDGS